MAGAYAGAVAGAMAGALSARGGVVNMFRSPEKAQSGKHKSPPAAPGPPQQSRSGGHHAPPKAPEEPPSPQRVIPRNPSAGNVSTGSGEGVRLASPRLRRQASRRLREVCAECLARVAG